MYTENQFFFLIMYNKEKNLVRILYYNKGLLILSVHYDNNVINKQMPPHLLNCLTKSCITTSMTAATALVVLYYTYGIHKNSLHFCVHFTV